MKDSIKKFYEALNASEDMQKRLAELDRKFAETHTAPSPAAGAETIDAFRKQAVDEIVIPVAKEAGYGFTSDDVMAYVKELTELSDQELSTDELQAVAGGKSAPYDVGGLFACGGVGIGFGTTSVNNDKCFILGMGVGACASEGRSV